MDAFEEDILTTGQENPSDKVYRLFGTRVNNSNAQKYLTGIRMYLKKKHELPKELRSPDVMNYSGDGSRTYSMDVTLTDAEADDPTAIMRKMGLDPTAWQLLECKLVRGNWDTTIKNSQDLPQTVTNHRYSVTIKVRPITGDHITTEALIAAIESTKIPELPKRKHDWGNADYLLELPIMDVHLGKLSWGEETRGGDYDLHIASDLYKDTVGELIDKVTLSNYPVARVVFPIGQDFFHFDNPWVQTTGGTQLDSDTRWQKMYRTGIDLLLWAVEQCRMMAPVDVVWVPGNHDQMLSYTAVLTLKHFYSANDDVTVDSSPTPRKYYRWGKNLIGYAHGREEGKRINTLMQLEAPVDWAETEYREWHMGDLHHEAAKEEGGIMFRLISSITSPDAWHAQKGYGGALRKASAYVWDKDNGLDAIFNSVVHKEFYGDNQ